MGAPFVPGKHLATELHPQAFFFSSYEATLGRPLDSCRVGTLLHKNQPDFSSTPQLLGLETELIANYQ
jgi:hypothetical protein